MFTGIIQAVGTVQNIMAMSDDARFLIDYAELDMKKVELGESIAVNGVCLTVIDYSSDTFSVDISKETLKCTGFNEIKLGMSVNLERAMQLDDRLNGHLVSGHVDGVSKIIKIKPDGRSVRYDIEMPSKLAPFICTKGSITVDGTSLTVNAVSEKAFSVNIIPHTLQNTIMNTYQVGTLVNLEIDMVARYLQRWYEFQQNENTNP